MLISVEVETTGVLSDLGNGVWSDVGNTVGMEGVTEETPTNVGGVWHEINANSTKISNNTVNESCNGNFILMSLVS